MSRRYRPSTNELIALAIRLTQRDVVAVTPVPRADSEEPHAFEVRLLTLIDSTGNDALDLSRATDIKVQLSEKNVAEVRLNQVIDRMCGRALPVFRLLRLTTKAEGSAPQYQWRDCKSGETSARFVLAE